MDSILAVRDGWANLLAEGLLGASGWQVLAYTLGVTHLTIVSVTLFLHRAQAHRALDLHPVVSHVLRFWLWLTTGIVTREWVAVHRKHHAKCETADDPHSPIAKGISTVFWKGYELYRAEADQADTVRKYGHRTPDDFIERHLYSRFTRLGLALMLVIDLALFGAIGLTVWAIQMVWIPLNAAGIINGIGHYWGYRNFEVPDASTNILPWGTLIGGEELHNNHHTFPTSAKFSIKPFEFDLGWVYIRGLERLRLAKARKVAPRFELGDVRPVADSRTLEALIANRYEVMARYAKELQGAVRGELERMKAQGAENSVRFADMLVARHWLHRDTGRIPKGVLPQLHSAVRESPSLAKLVAMREELQLLWTRTNVSAEQLVSDLQAWCRQAEESGIAALQDFSRKLRAAA